MCLAEPISEKKAFSFFFSLFGKKMPIGLQEMDRYAVPKTSWNRVKFRKKMRLMIWIRDKLEIFGDF